MSLTPHPKIAVIGLGYVGLPPAVALSRHFEVVGFDIDAACIAELAAGCDRTREVAAEAAKVIEKARRDMWVQADLPDALRRRSI